MMKRVHLYHRIPETKDHHATLIPIGEIDFEKLEYDPVAIGIRVLEVCGYKVDLFVDLMFGTVKDPDGKEVAEIRSY